MGHDIQKVEPDQKREVALTREGYNDKPVEIFRAGQMFEAYLSHVRVNDCFHFMHRPSEWFKCVVPVRKSYMPSDREMSNPTFSLDALEIMQAAPTIDTWPKLNGPSVTHKHVLDGPREAKAPAMNRPKLTGPDDVIDVDMKVIDQS